MWVNIGIVIGLRFLIFASIVIWCVVIPGYKAVSRAVGIGVGAVCALMELANLCDFYYYDIPLLGSFLEKIGVLRLYFYIIELVMAFYLFMVVWKTHSWKYKVPAGIVGILNVVIGIVSNLAYLDAIVNVHDSYHQLAIRMLVPKSIGLIITLIVIWVMLILFLQTNSNGKYSSSVIVCPACGARLEEQLNFCPKCGYRFK